MGRKILPNLHLYNTEITSILVAYSNTSIYDVQLLLTSVQSSGIVSFTYYSKHGFYGNSDGSKTVFSTWFLYQGIVN